ncbi:MAG: molecular chaperone DnaK, partial [Moorea sp. SIO2C4]|nr:molecular chaperone DnaK [Moorena sp. SIO2C4]
GLIQEMRQSVAQNDDRAIDRTQGDLQDALYELKREVRLQYEEEEDDDLFGSIRRTFTGDSDTDRYSQRDYRRDSYDSYGASSSRSSRDRDRRNPLENDWDEDDNWF